MNHDDWLYRVLGWALLCMVLTCAVAVAVALWREVQR